MDSLHPSWPAVEVPGVVNPLQLAHAIYRLGASKPGADQA
jgi:hypothetical protein